MIKVLFCSKALSKQFTTTKLNPLINTRKPVKQLFSLRGAEFVRYKSEEGILYKHVLRLYRLDPSSPLFQLCFDSLK